MTTQTFSLSTEKHAVLRNTYMLLSVTVLWSALTAAVGTQLNIGSWALLGIFVASFVALFATMFLRNSGWGLVGIFVFTGLEGLSLGPLLSHYLGMANGASVVMQAAGLTGIIFLALSGYVLVTGKSFKFMGGFLFAGLIALLVASIASIFIPGISYVVAVCSALLFSGYILYDTSEILNGGEDNYIMATVSLYLDILNLFMALLRILKDD